MWNFKKDDLKNITNFDYNNASKLQVLKEMSSIVIRNFGFKAVLLLSEKLEKHIGETNLNDAALFFMAIQTLFESFTEHCKHVLNCFDSQIESISDEQLVQDLIKKSFKNDD